MEWICIECLFSVKIPMSIPGFDCIFQVIVYRYSGECSCRNPTVIRTLVLFIIYSSSPLMPKIEPACCSTYLFSCLVSILKLKLVLGWSFNGVEVKVIRFMGVTFLYHR